MKYKSKILRKNPTLTYLIKHLINLTGRYHSEKYNNPFEREQFERTVGPGWKLTKLTGFVVLERWGFRDLIIGFKTRVTFQYCLWWVILVGRLQIPDDRTGTGLELLLMVCASTSIMYRINLSQRYPQSLKLI